MPVYPPPGSVSEKLRSNGYVCQDNQVHFISVEMTPGFAIISQTMLILQPKMVVFKNTQMIRK